MSYLTEKEQVGQHQHFAFKMRNLYVSNKALFEQVQDLVPYSIHINKQENLDIIYTNNTLILKGPEMEQLVKKGSGYLKDISCPFLLRHSIKKAESFKQKQDADAVCAYLQKLQFYGDMTYFYSTKLLLGDNLYFNISNSVNEMGLIGRVFKAFFDPLPKNHLFWQKFQSLTKQEKKILKLLTKGKTSKEISNLLFISSHTVDTHKKNIKRKLGVHRASELYKLSIVLDLDML